MALDQITYLDVLDFWFPDNGHETSVERHGAFWAQRMQGGMDGVISERFAALTHAAARGERDDWLENAGGWLALIIVLDQFSRTIWRDTPSAFAQDIKATRLALSGLENGHFEKLAPWEKMFVLIAIGHCEGPDHLERVNRTDVLVDAICDAYPEPIRSMAGFFREQSSRTKAVIEAFGRHPHRNAILGRISTHQEESYIASGEFPHLRQMRS